MTSSSRPISTSTLTSACAWPHADRAIFLRICEDRGIEDYGTLQNLIGKPGVYRRLMERFEDADKRYNSGLFDFRKDTVRKTGTVPDCGRVRAAGDCPRFSYPPKSPYEFSVIGIEILGEVYEQLLDKVIRLTAGHQAKVEEEPEVGLAGCPFHRTIRAKRETLAPSTPSTGTELGVLAMSNPAP